MAANDDCTLALIKTTGLHRNDWIASHGNSTTTFQLVLMSAVLAGATILGVHLFDSAMHATRFRECFLSQADRVAIPTLPLRKAIADAIALPTAPFASALRVSAKLLRALFARVVREENPERVAEILLTQHLRSLGLCKRDSEGWIASREF